VVLQALDDRSLVGQIAGHDFLALASAVHRGDVGHANDAGVELEALAQNFAQSACRACQ
jgi:hypothetical protein